MTTKKKTPPKRKSLNDRTPPKHAPLRRAATSPALRTAVAVVVTATNTRPDGREVASSGVIDVNAHRLPAALAVLANATHLRSIPVPFVGETLTIVIHGTTPAGHLGGAHGLELPEQPDLGTTELSEAEASVFEQTDATLMKPPTRRRPT